MGNGYFRTSQTSTTSRQRDKRGKDSYSYQHNYVDRVRLEDTNVAHYQTHHHHQHNTTHDPRCPQLRAAGWRHTHKSVSHLDLATSCHGAAGAGIDRPHRQQLQVQLRHHHQAHHHHSQEHHPQPPLTPHAQPHWTQCRVGIAASSAGGQLGQLRNARSLDYTQLEREENLDIAEFYWRIDAEAPLEQLDNNYSVNDNLESTAAAAASTDTTAVATTATTAGASAATGAALGATVTATFLDFGSESCSLRRSRSLAVIREETFSDLQIGSANSSRRRSQLIPRARLVNRGFFRESPRPNNKQQQQQVQSEQPTEAADDAQSNSSGANTCDSHQQQQQLLKQQQQQQKQLQQQQQQQHAHQHCPQRHQRHQRDPHDFDVYYDNLKRLDALALGLSEQLHPWHNDKSDLESLNSDYFKNSLHQNHGEQQQQPSSLEFEALEQAVTLLSERPRIYQSRRQQQHRSHHYCQQQQQRHIDQGGESCPEHSQSSVFPETTTSNSDDQTDTPSLSEQEYDLTHIEQIFQQTDTGDVEESYELISLTTTTRTRFESSEEEGEEERRQEDLNGAEESLTTPTETAASDSDCTLKRAHSQPLDKLIAYDSVYLSSEDSSECTLIGESCESFEQRTFTSCLENGELETRSLLHISIEDTVYEPQPKQHKKEKELVLQRHKEKEQQQPAQNFTQVLKVEHVTPSNHINVGVTSSAASKPRILSVVEKRKLKQEEQKQPAPPELKRQATDTFVVKSAHKSNLTENQYHSLPDVNISVSLKACENIDKELRTSYNLQRQQQRKETKRQKDEVTRAETYDSIRRFGRAHQKARQREYEEREKQREKEEATHVAEKETKQQSEQHQVVITEPELPEPIHAEVVAKTAEEAEEEEEEEEEPLPPPPPPITEDEFNDNENCYDNDNANLSVNDNQLVSLSHPEQPKEAPVIEVANFSKLIERRAQELRHQRAKDQPKEQQPQSFQIIVTDAHNNIIQTEAIHEEQTSKPKTTLKSNPTALTNSVVHPHTPQRLLRRSNSSACGKPPERRVLSAGASIYKARPVKVLSTASGDNSFGRQKMSRPQILHVVDSSSSGGGSNSVRRRSSARSIASNVSGEVATEYLQKVDAVKCYWNKLAGGSGIESAEKADKPEQEPEPGKEPRLQFQLGNKVTPSNVNSDKPHGSSSLDYCSIMPPSIEIVELGDGSQKATIVSAAQLEPNGNGDDDDDDGDGGAQFDHIRYKVLKSQQLIRNSNILTPRNKKEAQFDGLIQYLQDYSFQELLSNNNVVIVEPVRTKIERPLQVGGNIPPAKPPRLANTQAQQATTAEAPKKTKQRQVGGAGAKRHFFYQPVRVNRELYEDELPDPDTVRNVRRFFEQNILPTPGQGILVQSQQKFGGSACQLSPKSRRARGYRYLTIDTSYGGDAASAQAVAEEQPKGMEQLLEEHKVKQWDNASLSSGISSGDLSSPCGECHNQPESMTKESATQACKGVHVLDVVRRHNSNAANAKARAKLASRRTWCVGGGIAAGDSRYRQIYEHNLEAHEDEHDHHVADDDEDDDDDRDEDDDDTAETDMCESYYVSNDVLAKIRECGSTVTYYGGRVLERQTPERTTATMQSNRQLINGNAVNGYSTSSTRSRVRQIESCNVCPPTKKCEHEVLQTKQQLEQQQQDSYQGIKFKLVKSNSCSSRLELAGANDADGSDSMLLQADTEVVRKMVHHFECNQPTAKPAAPSSSKDVNVTINSQSTAAKNVVEATAARRQVTVNNHINVLREQGECQDVHDKQNEDPATYQSQAMNIRLDLSAGRGNNSSNNSSSSNSDKPNNNSKVCRNKNVDLAYTLTKQTPPQAEARVIVNQGTPSGNQWSQLNAVDEQQMMATKKLIKQPEMVNGREQIIVPVQIHQTQQQHQQHQQSAGSQERRLSNASSSASIVDKSVVRHYVANDKSIYERRKYDEIEFEEFEVYDPAKELERQQQEQELSAREHTEQSNSSIDRRHTDGELYDSLDDRV